MLQDQTEPNKERYRDLRMEANRTIRRKKKNHKLQKFQELEHYRLDNRPRKFYQELLNIKKG